ncbi:MAG TPA: hypothetical protein VK749_19070 [Xanthobacteraceae bacterium]|jgi:hypothetical protein|nr:hypothetical protein [Xanthobacteraceae bacterium]
MVEGICQPLAEFILQGFVQVLCYFIAKWTIPFVTLGRVQVGDWQTNFPHRKWWGNAAYIRLPNGKISIEPELASLLGLILLIPLSILAVMIYSHIK